MIIETTTKTLDTDTAAARMTELFPHVVLRVAGGPFLALRHLEAPRTMILLAAAHDATAALREGSAQLCDALYRAATSVDESSRRIVLHAKRAAFNQRPIKDAAVLLDLLDDDARATLERYVAMHAVLCTLDERLEQTFDEEVLSAREALRAIAASEPLQNALVLSSRQLLASVREFYLRKPAAEMNGKDLDTELGVMKYVSRMLAKTSPFSTLTTIGHARLDGPSTAGRPRAVSHVRLNNVVYAHLHMLLVRHVAIRKHVPVRLNPTIRRKDDTYVFLLTSGSVEAFQSVAHTPALELAHELATAGNGAPFGKLVAALAEHATEAHADAYLTELVSLGFLELSIPVSGVDPEWDMRLAAFLEPLRGTCDDAAALIDALVQLRAMTRAYEWASVEERDSLLVESRVLIERTCERLLAGAIPPEASSAEAARRREQRRLPDILFYEDTAFDTPLALDAPGVRDVAASLVELFDAMRGFEMNHYERDEILAHAERNWAGATRVPLLDFYESFTRETMSRSTPTTAGPRGTLTAAARARHERHVLALNTFGEALVPTTRIDITPAMLAPFRDSAPPRDRRAEPAACTTVVQLFHAAGALRGVLSSQFIGYGKMVGRFLHLLDADLTRDLQAANAGLAGGAILAEAADDSFSNANLHPPLLPYELGLPGAHHALPPERRISVTELEVERRDGEVALVHAPTGVRVYAFDLGIQAQQLRSPLFRLLSRFTLPEPPLLAFIETINRVSRRNMDPEAEVFVRPRITYDDRIVLQRQTWVARKDSVPTPTRGESAAAYFRRVDTWRRGHGIPDDVFVYLYPSRDYLTRAVKTGEYGELRQDDRKPQMISFRNPFLVRLLGKLAPRALVALQFVELLPGPAEMLAIDGEPRATEAVLQWYHHG